MRVLLDTCVLSELGRPSCNPAVRHFIANLPEENLFVSVLTLGELSKGMAALPDSARKRELARWALETESQFVDRLLGVDADTARLWGEMTAGAAAQGVTIPAVDGLIAATARRHGLYLVTRNVRDFAATGVSLINPWE